MNRAQSLAKSTGVPSHMIEPFITQPSTVWNSATMRRRPKSWIRSNRSRRSPRTPLPFIGRSGGCAGVPKLRRSKAGSASLGACPETSCAISPPHIHPESHRPAGVDAGDLGADSVAPGFFGSGRGDRFRGNRTGGTDGPASMCQILALAACPIAFWRGDFKSARRLTENLLDYSRRNTLNRWLKLGLCYQAVLDAKALNAGMSAEESMEVQPGGPLQRHILATICDDWTDPPTIELAERGLCGWATPEILRAVGAMRVQQGLQQSAEANYAASLAIAREQGALAWELRTTMSLALLLRSRGRVVMAARQLQSVYDKFTEGFESADLVQAQSLLEEFDAGRSPVQSSSRPFRHPMPARRWKASDREGT